MTTTRSSTDAALDTLAGFAPLAGPALVIRNALARSRTARDDGASTVEMIVWSGIALAAALGVGAVLYAALRNRAGVVGNDIQNQPIPNGG